jgi:hypothetical protein
MDLGSLGVERAAQVDDDPITFNWFGDKIRIVSEFNEIELVDLMERADNIDVNDLRAATAIKDMIRLVISEDDFDTFWATANAKRQKLDDLMAVFQVLIEAATNRPTQQRSDSSPGPQPTPASLPVASSSAASAGRPGRPDLVIISEDDAQTRQRVKAAAAHAAATAV